MKITKLLSLNLLLAMLVPSFALAAYNGTPTPKADFEKDGNCYLIKNAEDLYGFAAIVNGGETNACGKLMDSIVVNGSETETLTSMLNEDGSVKSGKTVRTWTPIGTEENPYTGTFNGNGFAVKGLYFNDTEQNNVGLFGYIGYKGIVKQISVEDSYFKASGQVGTVAGTNKGYIANCYTSGSVNGSAPVGGIVGYNNAYGGEAIGTVMNSYNMAIVTGEKWVGSIAGLNASGPIMNSFAQEGSANTLVGLGYAAAASSGFRTEEEFHDGTVAIALHDWCKNDDFGSIIALIGVNCDAWGQHVDHDAYPVLSSSYDQSGNLLPGEIKFDIDYVLSDGDEAEDAPKTYTYGTGATLKDPTRSNYAFVGWYDNESFTGDAIKTIATNAIGAKTFYAKWQELPTLVDNCYEIANAEQLYGFAALVNGIVTAPGDMPSGPSICGKLKNDITVNENVLNDDGTLNTARSGEFREWTPIGGIVIDITIKNLYKGSFNGNGYAVKGLYINDDSKTIGLAGLFGYVDTEGKVDQVGVEDSYFMSSGFVGGVVAYNKGSVTNCYNNSTVKGNSDVGGIVGKNDGGSITNCYNAGSVDGNSEVGSLFVGSIVGYNNGSVTNCFAKSGTAEILLVGNDADAASGFKTEDEFHDGTVAILLHNWCEQNDASDACKENGKNGSIWGQYVGTGADHDAYPVLGNDENGSGAVKFDIDYVWNDGDEAEDAPKTYTYGTGVTLKDPTRTNYTFVGWYDNETFTGDAVTTIATDATGAKTFYAKWLHMALVDDVYEIYDVDALYKFAELVNNGQYSINGKLMNDIVVNSNVLKDDGTLNTAPAGGFKAWTPIGYFTGYKGSFNGNGFAVKGLYFSESRNYVGFFGHIGSNGVVDQVRVEDSYFNGSQIVGGVAGRNEGYITNSYNSSSVKGGNRVGGIAGSNYGHITNSNNDGFVNGGNNAGGVAGDNGQYVSGSTATITNSYNRGRVNGSEDVGGIVGKNEDNIVNSYNKGSIVGTFGVGGIAGYSRGSGSITNSFALEGSAAELVGKGSAADAASGFKTEDEFHNGIVATLLHDWCELNNAGDACKANGKNGLVWGQDLSVSNSYPDFSGKMEFNYGSIVISIGETKKATILGNSELTANVPSAVEVSSVEFDRTFITSPEGKYIANTIVLPFSTNEGTTANASFYAFTGVSLDNGIYTAKFGTTVDASELSADVPYAVILNTDETTLNMTLGSPVSVKTGTVNNPQIGKWEFSGSYANRHWDDGCTAQECVYGFAAADDPEGSYAAGDFVKGGINVNVKPMRAVLKRVSDDNPSPKYAPSFNGKSRATDDMPEVIAVLFGDNHGEVSYIGQMNTRTGAITLEKADSWFDMKGRRLNAKPTVKGTYYYNGKIVNVK